VPQQAPVSQSTPTNSPKPSPKSDRVEHEREREREGGPIDDGTLVVRRVCMVVSLFFEVTTLYCTFGALSMNSYILNRPFIFLRWSFMHEIYILKFIFFCKMALDVVICMNSLNGMVI
jgi:hypothetical protein